VTPYEEVDRLRARLKLVSDELKELVANPEVIDEWTPAEQAWMLEHLEHLQQEATHLIERINAELARRRDE